MTWEERTRVYATEKHTRAEPRYCKKPDVLACGIRIFANDIASCTSESNSASGASTAVTSSAKSESHFISFNKRNSKIFFTRKLKNALRACACNTMRPSEWQLLVLGYGDSRARKRYVFLPNLIYHIPISIISYSKTHFGHGNLISDFRHDFKQI